MNTSLNKIWSIDAIDDVILNQGLRIKDLYFDKELDLMLIILNNRKVLKRSISDYKMLANASIADLQTYQVSKTGVHWDMLDEDLSLRGFLEEELLNTVIDVKIAS
jgi:hypothetical protein